MASTSPVTWSGSPSAIGVGAGVVWVAAASSGGHPGNLVRARDQAGGVRVTLAGRTSVQPVALAVTPGGTWVVNAPEDPRDPDPSLPVQRFAPDGQLSASYRIQDTVAVVAGSGRVWLEAIGADGVGHLFVLDRNKFRQLVTIATALAPARGGSSLAVSADGALLALVRGRSGLAVDWIDGTTRRTAETGLKGQGSLGVADDVVVVAGTGEAGVGAGIAEIGATGSRLLAGRPSDPAAVIPSGSAGWALTAPDAQQDVAALWLSDGRCSVAARVRSPGAPAAMAGGATSAWIATPGALTRLTRR